VLVGVLMRIAVRSRYTNINGGYEQGPTHSDHPSFRRTDGCAWIFHDARLGSGGPLWHFGPSLPSRGAGRVAAFFSSSSDGPTPDAAEWPDHVERVWQPSGRHRRNDDLFVDKEFPPSRRSLGDIPPLAGGKEPDWVPVRQLRSGTWKLFEGGISPNDLLQGSIGNCWLVAAMASLAEFPEAVEALFLTHELTASGRCEVQLHDMKNRRVKLSIDEFIPCHPREWWDEEGTPLFARPNGNEAWVLLLEKAFAKMLGSYMELSGGNCCTAFRAFTGEANVFVWARGEGEVARVEGEWKRMDLAKGDTHFVWNPGMEDRRDAEGLWDEVRTYDQQSYLVACSMRAVHGQEHVRIDGLVEAHAYSLLHAVEVEGNRLLFLRNPWGNDKRWNGRWSDGDDAWAKNPGVRRRLRPEFRDDGAFWIAWVDFQAIFDFVFVCARTMRSGAAAAEHARRSADGEVPAVPLSRTNPRRRLAEAIPERLPRLAIGSRVELMGLTSRLELNGRVTEVVRWDDDAGVYEVQDVPSPYWTCPECGEVNKRKREACNVCGGEKRVLAPDEVKRYRVRPECVILPPGTEVQVDGLVEFPELNGKGGKIIAFDRRAGRYHVELDDGHVRAIRPPHLIAKQAPEKEAEFGRWTAPVSDPSHVDEPEPPADVPCESDEEVRRIFEELDEECRLRKDMKEKGLRRGQQLLREGEMNRRVVEEIRRGGRPERMPRRLRFTRQTPSVLRFGIAGAYLEAIFQLDNTIAQLIRREEERRSAEHGHYSFFVVSRPGWAGPTSTPPRRPLPSAGPPAVDLRRGRPAGGGSAAAPPREPAPAAEPPAAEAPRGRRPAGGGWAGWICRECGHVNGADADICENCEEEEG